MQEEVRHFFEAGLGCKVLDSVSADGQAASLAIHVAQASRGRDDSVQSVRHASRMDGWTLYCQR